MKKIEQESLTTIKDMNAFNKRSKMKLEEMVNPNGDMVTALDTGKYRLATYQL